MGDAASQPPTFPPPNPLGWLCSLPTRAGCWPKAVVDFDSDVAGGCVRFFCLVFSFSYFLFFSPLVCIFVLFFFSVPFFFCTCCRLDSGLWWLVVAPIAPIWAGIQVLWAAHRCLQLRWMKLALPHCLRLDCMIAQVIGERGFDW